MDNDDKATELLWQASFEKYGPAQEVDFIEIPQRCEHALVLFNFGKRNKDAWKRSNPAA
jgi:hypothetical protein